MGRRLDSMIECLGACIVTCWSYRVFCTVNLTLRASAQDKVVVLEGLLCKSLRLFEWIGIRGWSRRGMCACVGSGAAGSVIGSLIINRVSLIQHVTA